MSSKFFDSHSHPQFAAYDLDRRDVISRMIESGVVTIAVGTSYQTSKSALELAKNWPGKIWTSVGIHPHHVTKPPPDPWETTEAVGEEILDERFRELLNEPEAVAVGETGLDFHYDSDEETRKKQRQVFLKHLELAQELKKPLVVHARDAYPEAIEILSSFKGQVSGAIHFFQGSRDQAKALLDLGYLISFAGPITFSSPPGGRAGMVDEVVKFVPLDRILIETDAPYVSPVPYRGKRNEPSYVISVARKIADFKGVDVDKIAQVTFENAKTLFPISQKSIINN